jgi:uncharacterized membrane protein YcaP (DUF421 family)
MDVVARAAIIFVVLWALTRVSGKREISELSAFEFVVIVTIGDLVGPTVMQEGYSLTAGFLAVTTFFLLGYGMALLNRTSRRGRHALEGRPTILIKDGKPDSLALRSENLSLFELLEQARGEGIFSLDEVQLALIEANGRISFLRAD